VSDDLLHLIPTDPGWVPDEVARRRVLRVLRELAPDAAEVTAETSEAVVFVDAGENSERVGCPGCGAELDLQWWQAEMDRAFEHGFTRLAVVTPCCRTATTLNDLDHVWPAGFARTVLRVTEPARGWLTPGERDRVARALGHPVREVRTRY
jgi:hypothetical protein